MVYKKFVMKNGRKFGPYYYESYRDGDKIRKRYLGTSFETPEINKTARNFSALHLVSLIFAVSIMISMASFNYLPPKMIGNAILGILPSSENIMDGKVSLELKQGELIPADSIVKIKLNEQEKSIPLNELLNEEQKQGDFYLENLGINGFGKGYGISGMGLTFPRVYFMANIGGKLHEKSTSLFESLTHDLSQGTFNVIKGSARTSEKALSDDAIKISYEPGKIIVSAEYYEIKEGFGKEFLGNKSLTLSFYLKDFKLEKENGRLRISLAYKNALINEAEREI